ncbi:MAG: hypothetical protein NTX97_01380 [Bacteroidetes bacterium]|nr:hypothetical protein [Bacteroidota bacterium]
METLYKNALNDKSYYVLSSSLSAIGKLNPAEALITAKQLENEKNNDVLFAVASLYANNGSDENNDFFLKNASKFNGYSLIGFVSQYGAFLRKVQKDETVNAGVDLLASIAKDESIIKWVAYYAKRSIKDLITMYDDRISFDAEKIKKLKESNPNADTKELETQIESAKAQKQRISDVFISIK